MTTPIESFFANSGCSRKSRKARKIQKKRFRNNFEAFNLTQNFRLLKFSGN